MDLSRLHFVFFSFVKLKKKKKSINQSIRQSLTHNSSPHSQVVHEGSQRHPLPLVKLSWRQCHICYHCALSGSPFTALPVCCLRKQGSSAPPRDGFNFYRPSRSRTSSFCFTICANHKASHKVKLLQHNSGSKSVAGGFQWVTCCINKVCKVLCFLCLLL